jgi:hypothetical protein
MKNNLFKTLSICCFVASLSIGSNAQGKPNFSEVYLDSSIVLNSEGLVFRGKILLSDSVRMPQEILFAPSYDTFCFICSGNIELEFEGDTSFVPVIDSTLSNIPPLRRFIERDRFYKEKGFEDVIRLGQLKHVGRYRLRVRFYLSKYHEHCDDIVSAWYFFDIPLSGDFRKH